MGLDMYLEREIYIGAEYDHRNVTGVVEIAVQGKKLNIDFKKISSINEKVGYWRKANQIHNWFVENVQDGEDECQRSYVTTEQLQELKETCEKVLADHNLAEELLPCQSGSFFGGTDYDEWYFRDLEDTVKILEDALENDEGAFYYQASW